LCGGRYSQPPILYTCFLESAFEGLIRDLLSGDVRALARALTIAENRDNGWKELLRTLFPHSGHAKILGLTGQPGAGKSTLVDQLARYYRKLDSTVGIIAVDPSSPYTGGSILGDRIRMQDHFADAGIFIRSMATRGALGGLSRSTADATTILDASGRAVVIIETVGVGQDEVDIVRLADVTVVILVPGMGDDVQSIKAGIMEIADIFVINKSDRNGADRVEHEIRALQSLAVRPDHWTPPIVKTVASEGLGIEGLALAISSYEEFLKKEGLTSARNTKNWELRLVEMLRESLLDNAHAKIGQENLSRYASEVERRITDPYSAIDAMVGGII
jgi:LAO/AO transport system kinase